jgi:ATP-dependent DNA helicase DinG
VERLAGGAHGRVAPVLCHRPAIARRLGLDRFPALDLLELYAFVRPARFCLPTPRGLAAVLDLPRPGDLAAEAQTLGAAMRTLLTELCGAEDDRSAVPIAQAMARGGWAWAPAMLAALGLDPHETPMRGVMAGLDVWRRLMEWSEHAPPTPPGHRAVEPAEARARLAALIAGHGAEDRPQQADYASAASAAFQPRNREGEPALVLAEAGTGVGKTQGYIAPASV